MILLVQEKYRVNVANGSFVSIHGKGLVSISPSLKLSYVFHVPNNECKMWSIGKVTKALNYYVNFVHTQCVF